MLLKKKCAPIDDSLSVIYDKKESKYVVCKEEEFDEEKFKKVPKCFKSDFKTQIGVLHITSQCNLACKYCYNIVHKDKKDIFSSIETTLTVIDKLQELADEKHRKLHIEFHGGEPLLKWHIIKEVVKKDMFKDVSFSTQTNGTLITKEVAEYVSEKLIRIGISIDGPQKIHDVHRIYSTGKGSYESVLKGITLLKDYGSKFGIISTITNEFLNKITPEEYAEWLLEISPASVKFGTFFPRGRGKGFEDLTESFSKVAEFIINVFELLEDSNIVVANILRVVQNIVSPTKYMCMRDPCGAGEAMLAVTPDGKVFACEEFAFDKKFLVCDNIFTCDWKTITKSEAYKQLQVDVRNNSCSKCALQLFCGGGCKAKAYYSNGDIRIPYGCEMNKYLIKYVLTRLYYEGKGFLRKVIKNKKKEDSVRIFSY